MNTMTFLEQIRVAEYFLASSGGHRRIILTLMLNDDNFQNKNHQTKKLEVFPDT